MSHSIQPAHGKDYYEITEVWEASVRATHHFLPEKDILFFKPLILNEYLKAVDLYCTRDDQNKISGFLGVADHKIEMLFIHPVYFGKGIGKRLVDFAIHKLNSKQVDVNEQNPQAVGFYLRMGFKTIGRSETDGMGKPYPLLHLKWNDDLS